MNSTAKALLVVLAATLVGVPWFATFYTDWLWFGETGYQSVFVTTLTRAGRAGCCGLRAGAGDHRAEPAGGDAQRPPA